MKKVFVAVAVVALFASCKKDYVCKCTYGTGTNAVTTEYPLNKMKKADAKSACDVLNVAGNACTLN